MATDDDTSEVTLAVSFIDAVGSTALASAHGDRAAVGVAERLEIVAEELERRHVQVVKHLGDGLLAIADEVSTMVNGLQHALVFDRSDPTALRLRAGLAQGTVLQRKRDVHGSVVNLAARLCDAARAGSILMTTEAHNALPAAVGSTRRGDVLLKGVPEAVSVAELACGDLPGGWVEDPVCQMLVDPVLAAASIVDDAAGRHWFCSEECRAAYVGRSNR